MEIETSEKKSSFGLKRHGDIFLAAMKVVTGNGVLLYNREKTVDGMTVEVRFVSAGDKPPRTRKRRLWRRKKGMMTVSIMVRENGRVVFDASSQWKGDKKKRGWVRTFHEGLWTFRLMRAARIQDHSISVFARVYQKAVVLLSEQVDACEPLTSEMKYSPTAVIHRVFESEQIEVRGFEPNFAGKNDVKYKMVKVVYRGQEVFEAMYAPEMLSVQLPKTPKVTSIFVPGDWQKTLDTLVQ